MSYEFLSVDRCEAYTIVTLNRPKANALSLELVQEIRAAVAEADADDAVRCIVITGGEGRFFSGGADVPTLGSSLAEPFAEGGLLAEGLKMVDTVEGCTTPVVAAVNGVAVGGGCELALACHFRIAADSAQFGQPEINLGIIPGWGGCHRLPRIIGEGRALDWIVTGRMVPADEAYQAGLVCKVVPAAELQDAAKEFAALLAGQPAVAVRAAMRAVRERSLYPDRGKALEAEGFAEVAASQDAAEGISAFLEKRTPNFTGE
jgi:enoyl-CoA hydratase/carnithine racemase